MLYRTLVEFRGDAEVFAVEQCGELRRADMYGRRPGRDVVETDTGLLDYAVGPLWWHTREESLRAAIAKAERMSADVSALLDDLRNRLVNARPAVAAAAEVLQPHPPVAPAQCGPTPAVEARKASLH